MIATKYQYAEIVNVQDIEIKNIGIIKEANVKFSSGLNIIYGEGGSGKTTFIKHLLENYNFDSLSERQKVFFQIQNALNSTTLVFDDLLGRLNEKDSLEILKKLSDSKRQIILTINSIEWQKYKNKIRVNAIDTASFALNNFNHEN